VWNHLDSEALRPRVEKTSDFSTRKRADELIIRQSATKRQAVKLAPSSLPVTMDSKFEGSRWEMLEASLSLEIPIARDAAN
jgi:hypothetical protein